ncbi:unnamed protein product [Rotaria magnacalcarata]|uniref:Uncharacterized protein n=1 Tax=Rotaria magnacalcarata TaxID=392030 RepID=A0A8S2K5J0_9BILA|nr:unnamed protein product [Rotaria magnacalcarata]CAF3844991.1 unnamed protein product [Rotaria magnacalcarata]CAF3981271.1 unnamed protein product [Rotaria magnacalcarata]
MLGTEVELTKQLKNYLKEENKRIDHIKKFLDSIESEVSRAKVKEEKYFSNPINSFLFIKHLTIEWSHITTMVSPDLSKIIDKQWLFPSLEDYIGHLLGHDCYGIGRVAFAKEDFYHALMWMQEALDRFDQENNTALISKINILNNLAHATAQQGNIEHALAVTEEILSIDPEYVEAKKNKIHYESLIKERTLVVKEQHNVDFNTMNHNDSIEDLLKEPAIQHVSMNNKNFQVKNQRPGTYLELKSRQIFEKICRQQHSKLSPKRQATLFCRYRHNKHPYLIFRPVKEEQVLDEPGVFLFHDVVSDSDIEKIKALAAPRLQRALIRNTATNTMTPADYRISKSPQIDNNNRSNTYEHVIQDSSEVVPASPINHTIAGTTTSDNNISKQNAKFPPYIINFKKSQQNGQVTDRKLIEHLILEWKSKNNYVLNITGRFGHEKCLLIIANDETSFEELFNQQNWPIKINDSECDLKMPRV